MVAAAAAAQRAQHTHKGYWHISNVQLAVVSASDEALRTYMSVVCKGI